MDGGNLEGLEEAGETSDHPASLTPVKERGGEGEWKCPRLLVIYRVFGKAHGESWNR